jgi:hypothetical protein
MWKFVTQSVDWDCELFGNKASEYSWNSTGEKAIVPHPHSKDMYIFHIFIIKKDGKAYRIAAGEFSMNIHAIYVEV